MKRTSIFASTTVALLLILAAALPAQTANCSGVQAWAPNTSVTAGQLVTFSGSEYKCIQSHTTLTGWEPPNVPALWSLVGACGGTGATPTPTPKATATATPTPKPTATATASPRPTATATPRPTATATATATPKPTATPTPGSGGCAGVSAWAVGTPYVVGSLVTFQGSE